MPWAAGGTGDVTGVGSAVLDWVTGGSALAALGKVSLAVCALVLGLVYRRYLGILGADRRRPAERQVYDGLRNSLGEGNLAARLYTERLTSVLNWVDRFFGDAGMAHRTLFPHAFGLRTPAPLWTAPAFDRCLLIALIYPIATIFIIWAVSGHVGPAENALHLFPHWPGWERGLCALLLALALGVYPQVINNNSWKSFVWLIVGAIPVIGAVGFGASTGGIVVLGALSLGPFVAMARRRVPIGASSVAGAVAFACFSFIGGFAVAPAAVFFGVILGLDYKADEYNCRGLFLTLFVLGMIIICLLAAELLSRLELWFICGPLLLFVGLLTFLNAPFDWASLGLTRALLRRGLEIGGWWPYALALVDAGLAAVIIAALALTMVVGVQAFDALAVHGGGAPTLPLEPLFNGIVAHPSLPEYWWLYALLLSTMIPSLVNLVIGGTSLVRGLPGLPSLLLRAIPGRGGVLRWDRHWIATVLTAQVAAGAALGIAAQAFLVVVIIGYIMPFLGLELLDMARDVAAFDLPARVGQLFGVSL
jgi:hypothetical protein